MTRFSSLIVASLTTLTLSAQQLTLDWATPTVPSNNRVKTAAAGGVYALGTGNDNATLQRFSATGTLQWTKTLSAPSVYAIDMDVDGSDNCYIYLTFNTGQLDLDPGPNTALVNPGKVYAKYNSSGQYQWGFSIANNTDASEDYGGVSCDDAGNLYICGDLGQGVYDFDFGTGVTELTVGTFSTGSFMARYRPNGELVWANMEAYYGGFCNSRDIAAMRDGSSFYILRELDNGGSLGSQIDVDYGPNTHNVYNQSQLILRYDSALQFMAEGNINYGDMRLCADASGAAYFMGQASAGAGFWAVKYTQSGEDMTQVYQTSLPVSGNLRLGDIAPDEQGGCLGMYSNNGPGGVIRFYKMNVSGLVDFNLSITQGNDYTYPGGKGFDLDGSGFYFGTYNNGYPVDFDPGPGVLSLPTSGAEDGVVARFDWCAGAPYDPFEISTPGAVCTGQPATFTVNAFGDASGYEWTVPGWWTITDGQGTASITVQSNLATTGTVSVSAVNDCGTSAPIALDFDVVQTPTASLGPDLYACDGNQVFLIASPPDATYLWQDGSTDYLLETYVPGTFSVEVTVNGCTDSDTAAVFFLPNPTVELGPDQVICPGESVVLDAGNPGAEYQWSPDEGFGSVQTITVTPDSTTDYTVLVTAGGCVAVDNVQIIVDPCMGVATTQPTAVSVWPVPAVAGEPVQVSGINATDILALFGPDGRQWPLRFTNRAGVLELRTTDLAPGVYSLRLRNAPAVRIVLR